MSRNQSHVIIRNPGFWLIINIFILTPISTVFGGDPTSSPSDGCKWQRTNPGKISTIDRNGDIFLVSGERVRLMNTRLYLEGRFSEVKQKLFNQKIILRYSGLEKDRYGRHLAHLFLNPPGAVNGKPKKTDQKNQTSSPLPISVKNPLASKKLWLQAWLIREGMAQVYGLKHNEDCINALLIFEARARHERIGVWRTEHGRVKSVGETKLLLSHAGSFQIVVGQVKKAMLVGGQFYLNFGDDWRSDFTVAVARKNLKRFSKKGLNLKSLKGKFIRVRGWIEKRGGPFMRVDVPAMIEVLGAEPEEHSISLGSDRG